MERHNVSPGFYPVSVQEALKTYTNYTYNNPNNRFLGEYSGAGPVGPVDATAVAYYYFMVKTLAKSADILGKTADAATYRALANNIRDAYNARYWDATHEFYPG